MIAIRARERPVKNARANVGARARVDERIARIARDELRALALQDLGYDVGAVHGVSFLKFANVDQLLLRELAVAALVALTGAAWA